MKVLILNARADFKRALSTNNATGKRNEEERGVTSPSDALCEIATLIAFIDHMASRRLKV